MAAHVEDSTHSRERAPQGRPADLLSGLELLTVGDDHDLFEAAERFVYDVYRTMDYCAESDRGRVEEMQRWSPGSVFHIVHDQGDVVASCRNIFGSYADLPIGQLEREDGSDPDPVVEMSAMAIEPSARSTGVIEHLLRESWLYALRSDASALVAVVEPWFLEVFQMSYRLPWRPVGAGRDYMGGYSIPISLTLAGSSFEALARELPEFWRWALEAVEPQELAAWGLPIILTDPAEAPVAGEVSGATSPAGPVGGPDLGVR